MEPFAAFASLVRARRLTMGPKSDGAWPRVRSTTGVARNPEIPAHEIMRPGSVLARVCCFAPRRPDGLRQRREAKSPKKIQVRSQVDPAAEFSTYRTYGFVPMPGTNIEGKTTALTIYFMKAIRQEMDSRGYQYTEESPDLWSTSTPMPRAQSTPRRMSRRHMAIRDYYGYRAGLYNIPVVDGGEQEETITTEWAPANIDVVDARKKVLIWVGIAEGRLTEAMMARPGPAIAKSLGHVRAVPGKAREMRGSADRWLVVASLHGESCAGADQYRRFARRACGEILAAGLRDVLGHCRRGQPRQETGAVKTWENTATGNGGTIKLLKVFTSADGRDCRRLRIDNHAKSLKGSTKQTVCASPEGKWLTRRGTRNPRRRQIPSPQVGHSFICSTQVPLSVGVSRPEQRHHSDVNRPARKKYPTRVSHTANVPESECRAGAEHDQVAVAGHGQQLGHRIAVRNPQAEQQRRGQHEQRERRERGMDRQQHQHDDAGDATGEVGDDTQELPACARDGNRGWRRS